MTNGRIRMSTTQYPNLKQDVDEFRKTWEAASGWKRNFAGGSFKKQFKALLEKNQADEEIFLQLFIYPEQKGKWADNDLAFLEKFVDQKFVKLFSFLNCVLNDDKRKEEKGEAEFFGPQYHVFNTLVDNNRVSCESSKRGDKPYWVHPGIPCLTEALIQLLSAEKTKYLVKNNRWYDGDCCWEVSGHHARKLADIALDDLVKTPLYASLPIEKIIDDLKKRAQAVYRISKEQAKTLPNYREINGNPSYGAPGAYCPMPGHCQIGMSASVKEVDYVSDLKTLIIELNGLEIFQRYLGLDSNLK
jgi:hypothetical protein